MYTAKSKIIFIIVLESCDAKVMNANKHGLRVRLNSLVSQSMQA